MFKFKYSFRNTDSIIGIDANTGTSKSEKQADKISQVQYKTTSQSETGVSTQLVTSQNKSFQLYLQSCVVVFNSSAIIGI
jgi:hypothetical protein